MSAGPGVLLGGNYSAMRGSISAASCFLSPSLWPLAVSLECTTALLPHSLCVCVRTCVYSCMIVCFPVHCLFNSWLTDSICVSAGVCFFRVNVPLCVFSLWLV